MGVGGNRFGFMPAPTRPLNLSPRSTPVNSQTRRGEWDIRRARTADLGFVVAGRQSVTHVLIAPLLLQTPNPASLSASPSLP